MDRNTCESIRSHAAPAPESVALGHQLESGGDFLERLGQGLVELGIGRRRAAERGLQLHLAGESCGRFLLSTLSGTLMPWRWMNSRCVPSSTVVMAGSTATWKP